MLQVAFAKRRGQEFSPASTLPIARIATTGPQGGPDNPARRISRMRKWPAASKKLASLGKIFAGKKTLQMASPSVMSAAAMGGGVASPGMPAPLAAAVVGRLPVMAYVVLVVIVVVVIVASVFLSIAATSLKKSEDYNKKSQDFPKLKSAHQLAAWGSSIGFIGAGLIIITLIVMAVAGGAVLLRSKFFIWIFAFVAMGIAIACGAFAMMSSIRLIDSGAYDPRDAKMKKGYINDIWAALSAFVATVMVVGVTFYIVAKKPKPGAVGPYPPPAPPTIIQYPAAELATY